ncbi:PAS domain-containing sensor histidine kinase [Zobellella maritima]|uniref:PAS domain-containing sensor histidine kinase n=1 Tax=Zobellella maritima TaxID=2059725 RepID=UPI0018E4EACE|nr:PAS domain-containing sensor histidine kinase [Zobellella maritima]
MFIELDDSGFVIRCEGPLSAELPHPQPATPSMLADYLYSPAPLLMDALAVWNNQSIDLCFKSKNSHPLYTRGWLTQSDNSWQLLLTDVTDMVDRVNLYERKAQLLAYTMSIPGSLRSCHHLSEQTLELLEGLALRLRIPCIAIALENEGTWYLYQQYCRPGDNVHWWEEYQIDTRLSKLDYPEPLSFPLDTVNSHPALVWATPYQSDNKVCAWLLCAYYTAEQQAPYLSPDDWTQIAAQLITPLLQRLQEQQHHRELARYNTLQRLQNVGWWEYDPEVGLCHIAPHLLHTFGLPGKQAISLARWLDLLLPTDREEFRIRLAEACTKKTAFSQNLRLQIDDQSRWYRIDIQPHNPELGSCLIGTLLDIQEMKQQEIEVQTANNRLESLVASAPAIIYVQHYENGVLQPAFFSASLHSVLGWQPEQIQQESLAAFVHPDDHETFFERLPTLLSEGAISSYYRIRDTQHHYHWVLDEAKLLRDHRGQPQEVVGLCIDITDATIATERLRESEERYRMLVEDSPAIICRYRPDLTLTFANALFSRYLGQESGPLKQMDLTFYLSAEQLSAFRQRLDSLSPENPIANAEICLHLPNQEPLWVVWVERGIFNDRGELCEIQAVGRDNNEVHKTRLQLYQSTKMAIIGEMATTLAHEMNQPLNVMRIALVNLLRRMESEACSPEYIKNKLERIESQVVRASRIIEHMRIFGRRSALEKYPFDPQKAIEGALSLTRDALDKKGIEVKLRVAPLPQVYGHLDQLEQVLINLLVNAKDALLQHKRQHPELKPWIIIRALEQDSHVLLQVEDNGGGIPSHQLPEVFEPFFTTKPVGQGTGLGLPVSHGIIQQMQGKLSVDNAEHGALFTIKVPVAPE